MPSLQSYAIENYRSFYSRQILDCRFEKGKEVTALFGPNSGGKSNTARALALIQYIILNSSAANWILPYEPFLLREGAINKPTRFTLCFEHSSRNYIYSFSYTSERIVDEELKI